MQSGIANRQCGTSFSASLENSPVAIDIVDADAQGCSRSAVGDSKSVMLGTNRPA
jgi:hypothetical protein